MKKLMIFLSCALLASLSAKAQVVESYDMLRTNSWSFYGMGGASMAQGEKLYENIDPAAYVYASPMVGAGITFNARPWIRFNVGYETSKYRRQQRFDSVQSDGLSYRNLEILYNDVELNFDLNFMELFKNRESKKFNIYLGSGFGEMFAYGADYSIKIVNPETRPGFGTTYTYTSELNAHNDQCGFCSPYIPANISFEYDIAPRFSVGVRGSVKFMLNKAYLLSDMTESLGILVRYNLVGSKHGYTSKSKQIKNLTENLAAQDKNLNGTINQLRGDLDAKTRLADDMQKKLNALEKDLDNCNTGNAQIIEALRQELKDLRAAQFIVYFANASSSLDRKAKQTIADAAALLKKDPKAITVITASCSTSGSEEYNQALSERRAEAVRAALVEAGVTPSQISSLEAIGEKGMNADGKSRRAIIDVR